MPRPPSATRAGRKQARFYQRQAGDDRVAAQWYYRAREGVFGPFESRHAAEGDLAQLIFHHPNKRDQYLPE